MIYLSLPYFWRSYLSGEVSSNTVVLLIWPTKGLILLGFCLIGLQWFSELVKRIAIMRGLLQDDAPTGVHALRLRRKGFQASWPPIRLMVANLQAMPFAKSVYGVLSVIGFFAWHS